MTHVLLDSALDSRQDIQHRLSRWGMTAGNYNPRYSDYQWPTILECDLVIMGAQSVENHIADFTGADGESLAPVILLGVSGSLLLARDAWQVLPEPNPDSDTLRMAVQACLEQAALLRHGVASGRDREDFLSFLGHEMRSPLTAAKTALEVLQGDLGGLNKEENSSGPHLKMLEIALRNVRRLHNTVEWSQELLASSPVEEKIQLRDFAGRELEAVLGEKIPSRWDPAAKLLEVHTDDDSLCMLIDQVVRALRYAIPGCQPELSVQPSSEKPGALSLTLSPARGSVQDGAPRISRLGLNSSGLNGDSPVADLERLVHFVVSRVLVSCLGVGLEVVGGGGDEPGVKIQVPGVAVESRDRQTVGQLLTPA